MLISKNLIWQYVDISTIYLKESYNINIVQYFMVLSMAELNENITILEHERKKHTKASEEYINVLFEYDNGESWEGWVPLEYRRTGISIKPGVEIDYLNKIYPELNPSKYHSWLKRQREYWDIEKPRANTTREFFNCLIKGGWQCVECTLPKNRNWARRIQDIKEFGYTISTDINRYCPHCEKNTTHLLLVPLERATIGGNGYETWSPKLRKRIINVLDKIDIYENKNCRACLPDHKFPEIRWDENTKAENPDSMTDKEIKNKFQLLTNQRNQQKREVCRQCYQTGKRGIAFGIHYFYKGNEDWDSEIPIKGKAAELGCEGCAWYDFAEWRKQLLEVLEKNK